ncbi:MAG: hypothetical protein HXY25_12110, partial [Alphaproteobacteria bacterium]|nr:hypothetical protein [Alphaproteobacteria bacterium]
MSAQSPRAVLIGLVSAGTDGALAGAIEAVEALEVPRNVEVALMVERVGPERPLASILAEGLARLAIPTAQRGGAESLAAARNRMLALARQEGADFLLLFDDQVAPRPRFLRTGLSILAQYEAAVLCGRARPRVVPDLPRWAEGRPEFSAAPLPDRADIRLGGLGEARILLVDLARLGTDGPGFDASFARPGLSGQAFLAAVEATGARVVHCESAEAYASLPAERLTLAEEARDMRRRLAYAIRCERRARGFFRTAVRHVPAALLAGGAGLVLRALAPVFG